MLCRKNVPWVPLREIAEDHIDASFQDPRQEALRTETTWTLALATSGVPTHARQLLIHPRSHLKMRLLPNTNLLPLLLPTIEPEYRSWPPLKYCATFE